MRDRTKLCAIALGVVGTLAFAAPASAGQLVVDDDHLQCPSAQYTSIQTAVQSAAPGDTIQVCAGLYQETVTVDKPGLKLYSTPRQAAVIKAPPVIPTLTGAIVDVTATSVKLERFTITGPGGGPCNSLRYGVFVGNNGSADIRDNRITEIRDNPFSGCQNGVAVRIGSQFLGQVGHGTVYGNFIDRYQKGGVVVDGPGTTATVQQNRIQGVGPTPIIAQNGIQLSRGAAADADQNIVLDNSYTLPAFSSTGILLFQESGNVDVDQNEATRNDDNLAAYETTGTVIEHNDFWKSTLYDGIYMNDDTEGNLIRLNYLRNNAMFDCEDAGGANTWQNNDGVTSNPPGLCSPDGGEKPGRQRDPNRHVQPFL
jgi:nitrous oxidase accessory protein NosD